MGTVPEKIAVTRSIPTTSIPKPNLTGMRKEMEGGANQRREERIFWINDCFEDDKEEERGRIWCNPRAAESVRGAKTGKMNLNSCGELGTSLISGQLTL